jgi:hypothetical protein
VTTLAAMALVLEDIKGAKPDDPERVAEWLGQSGLKLSKLAEIPLSSAVDLILG